MQRDVASGRVYGTVYYKPGVSYKRAALLVHCFSTNRYALGVLAERLVEYGIICLSIDLPSHYLNPNQMTLGEISETITDGVLYIKGVFGTQRVAVIAHSVAAVGALFANAGYNNEIEHYFDAIWKRITKLSEEHTAVLESSALSSRQLTESRLSEISMEFEKAYSNLKQLIYHSLVKGIKENFGVSCYIFLAAPLSVKKSYPGKLIFKNLPPKFKRIVNSPMAKRVIELLALHPLAVAGGYKEGNPGKWVPKKEPEYFHSYFFKTQDSYDFLKYFFTMKEPADFFELMVKIIKFAHKDDRVNFFEYYMRKYLLPKPKLFIYGIRDLFLRPFFGSNKERLENFYREWGYPDNVEIMQGSFAHVMDADPKKHGKFLAIGDIGVTERIMRFLDKNL